MKRSIPCPTCSQAVDWTKIQPWRPFCSERCRLIDLGDWLGGAHRIAGDDGEATLSLEEDTLPPSTLRRVPRGDGD
ncbi:MAG: DNA gyrase inhibitor YacG [Gammaproteobacteria bacterium]